MPANQPNPVRGGAFPPGGNRNGTSLEFVRMASALTWCVQSTLESYYMY